MKIIISPAKKMNVDTDSFEKLTTAKFILDTEVLLEKLKELSEKELVKLWKCNNNIAQLNIDRLKNMDLYSNLTPSILAYDGIQFKYMGSNVFTYKELDFIQNHLYILSGFYGILRPLDGVTPYRLEMQGKLCFENFKNLYDFWGDKLAKELEGDFLLNLASKEYSKAVLPHLKNTKVITCVFAEYHQEKLVEKGTMCKMARGDMLRFVAQNFITNPLDIKSYTGLNYKFSKEKSDDQNYIFIKEN